MHNLFISHSSQDDGFVRDLQRALDDLGQKVWIDSRELGGGDPLWPEIQKAIENASAYAVVVSTKALQSTWVVKELRHAIEVQRQRGRDEFPIIPLSLNGTSLGVLEKELGEEPVYIPVSGGAGGIDAALNSIFVALGKRLQAGVPLEPQPATEPLEELVLELTDLKFHEQDGVRRASAQAQLVHEPAMPGQPVVASESWQFIAPIGPIEAEELRWYLEKYAIWPSGYFRDRAIEVEESLVKWGQLLHEAALPSAHTSNVMQDWERIDIYADRRFSVQVDARYGPDVVVLVITAAAEAVRRALPRTLVVRPAELEDDLISTIDLALVAHQMQHVHTNENARCAAGATG
jgi:TIR domain.